MPKRSVIGAAVLAVALLLAYGMVVAGSSRRMGPYWLTSVILTAFVLLMVVLAAVAACDFVRTKRRWGSRRKWTREELSQPRPATALACASCGYFIGDLEPSELEGGKAILCPECGLLNPLHAAGPPTCSVCHCVLGPEETRPGTVVRCPGCGVMWKIQAPQ